MNVRLPLLLLALAAPTTVLPAQNASAPAPLLDEALDDPNELVGRYPPGKEGVFRRFGSGNRIAAWSEGGVMELTYGGGYGSSGTGGLFARVHTEGARYYHVTVDRLAIPGLAADRVTPELFERLRLSFDTVVPLDRVLTVHLLPSVPENFAPRSRSWGSRVTLGSVVGAGKFERHVLQPRPGSAEEFARLFRDAAANGLRKAEFAIVFEFADPAGWMANEAVQLDNLRLEADAR